MAVRHVKPGAYPNAARDNIHHPSKAEKQRAAGSRRAATISSTTGAKNIAVIIVQFPAGTGSLISGSRTIVSLANIDTYFTQMAAYFTEVSYGQLTLTFKFFGTAGTAGGDATAAAANAITLAQPMEYYGCGDEGGSSSCNGVTTPFPGQTRANGDVLIQDALVAARANYGGSTPTKGNGAGLFDAVIVMHAGNGNETTTNTPGDIWAIYYSQTAQITAGGFSEGDVVPETETSGITSPLGVMVHEFGHELGLPDLYNTLTGASVVGDWDIMDYGPYAGAGANPTHINSWGKVILGWVTPQVASTKGSYSIGAVESSPATNVVKLPVQNGEASEYFLVEYKLRSAGSFDQQLPGDGLLVWHVDDGIASARGVEVADASLTNTVNSGSPHYGVSVVTADGVTISGSNTGGAGNLFGNGGTFTSNQSTAFNGQSSGISMANISGVGTATAHFDISNIASAGTQSILKLTAYPNPAGKGYAHASGEGHVTLQFQLARAAQTYSLNIYTVSGDLVKKIDQGDITLHLNDRSSDFKWVYEYIWDFKNGDGKMVAPGVYLYLLRVDGQTKTNKLVIIR